MEERVAHLEREVVELRRLVDHLLVSPWRAEPLEVWEHEVLGSVLGRRRGRGQRAADMYAHFTAIFRGSQERVHELLRPYAQLLVGAGPVLDLGCGRGELLDLLAGAGVEARGVDRDLEMAELARAKGHEVAVADIVPHLREQQDASLGAITAIHVVEHLGFESVLELIGLARRKLREDGILVLETVNPNAIHGAKFFWVDPTHRTPLFPDVLVELLYAAGFGPAFAFFPRSESDAGTAHVGELDYGVFARLEGRSAPTEEAIAVETDVGTMLLPAGDRVILPVLRAEGRWEPEIAALLRNVVRSGATVLDVGAHCGYVAMLLARLVGPEGRVVAVEAHPLNAELLRHNLEAAGLAQAEAVHAAAWREEGSVALSVSPVNTGDHRAYEWASGRPSVEVPAIVLDRLFESARGPDVVILDCQATEHVALEGMAGTLGRSRPLLLIEYWPQGLRDAGADPRDVLAYHRSLGTIEAIVGLAGAPPEDDDELIALVESQPGRYATLVVRT